MIKLSVERIGGDLAVVLPPEVLALLGVSVGDEVTLIESSNGLELVSNAKAAEQIEAARRVMRDDSEALNKLSE